MDMELILQFAGFFLAGVAIVPIAFGVFLLSLAIVGLLLVIVGIVVIKLMDYFL